MKWVGGCWGGWVGIWLGLGGFPVILGGASLCKGGVRRLGRGAGGDLSSVMGGSVGVAREVPGMRLDVRCHLKVC